MTIDEDDLWGEIIPESGKEKTPFTILQHQASLLKKKTEHLRGHVKRIKGNLGELSYMLEIVAPKLDNYSFGVLIISYEINMIYPVKLEPLVKPDGDDYDEWEPFKCGSEDEFLGDLKMILGSEEVRKVIQRLLSHISLEKSDEQTNDESEE